MGRLWIIAAVAEAFHVLPTIVAREMDDDPENLSIICLQMLRYAEAKRAEEVSKDEKDLEAWKGSWIMEQVLQNKFDLFKEWKRKKSEEKS